MAQTTLFWREQHFAPIYWKITIGKQQVFNFVLMWCLFLINIYLPDKFSKMALFLHKSATTIVELFRTADI